MQLKEIIEKNFVRIEKHLDDFGMAGMFMSKEDGSYLCFDWDWNVAEQDFLEKFGITEQIQSATGNTCSIGFNPIEGKWYGWSHRAIGSFNTKEDAAKFAEEVS